MRLAAALWCLALALRARSEPTTSEESLLEIHDLMDEMTDYEKDVRKLEKERGELDGAAQALRSQLANATAVELADAADASGVLARATREAVGGALRESLLEGGGDGDAGDETPKQAAQRARLDAAIAHLLGAAESAPSVRVQALEAQLEALTHATALLRVRLSEANAKVAAARTDADAAALEASKEIDRLTRDAEKAKAKADKHDGEMSEKRDEITNLKGNLTEARVNATLAAYGHAGCLAQARRARAPSVLRIAPPRSNAHTPASDVIRPPARVCAAARGESRGARRGARRGGGKRARGEPGRRLRSEGAPRARSRAR